MWLPLSRFPYQAKKKALESGMIPVRTNAIDKMLKGITTFHEVARVTEKL